MGRNTQRQLTGEVVNRFPTVLTRRNHGRPPDNEIRASVVDFKPEPIIIRECGFFLDPGDDPQAVSFTENVLPGDIRGRWRLSVRVCGESHQDERAGETPH